MVLKRLLGTCPTSDCQVTVPARIHLVLRHFNLKRVVQACLNVDLLQDFLLLWTVLPVGRAAVRDV